MGKKCTGKRLTRMGRKMTCDRRHRMGAAPSGGGVPDQMANTQSRSSVPRVRAMLARSRG